MTLQCISHNVSSSVCVCVLCAVCAVCVLCALICLPVLYVCVRVRTVGAICSIGWLREHASTSSDSILCSGCVGDSLFNPSCFVVQIAL